MYESSLTQLGLTIFVSINYVLYTTINHPVHMLLVRISSLGWFRCPLSHYKWMEELRNIRNPFDTDHIHYHLYSHCKCILLLDLKSRKVSVKSLHWLYSKYNVSIDKTVLINQKARSYIYTRVTDHSSSFGTCTIVNWKMCAVHDTFLTSFAGKIIPYGVLNNLTISESFDLS